MPGTMKVMYAVVPVRTSHVALRDMSCNCSECLSNVSLTVCTGWNIRKMRKENTQEEHIILDDAEVRRTRLGE